MVFQRGKGLHNYSVSHRGQGKRPGLSIFLVCLCFRLLLTPTAKANIHTHKHRFFARGQLAVQTTANWHQNCRICSLVPRQRGLLCVYVQCTGCFSLETLVERLHWWWKQDGETVLLVTRETQHASSYSLSPWLRLKVNIANYSHYNAGAGRCSANNSAHVSSRSIDVCFMI